MTTTDIATGAAPRSTIALRQARDQFLSTSAASETRPLTLDWPDLGDRFNWAHDWFDAFATGNQAPGLIVVNAAGGSASYTFDWLAMTSNQVARWLQSRGLTRGDAVVLMLGNQVELWQSMLALMKLGVTIVPTTTAVGMEDLQDRVTRSGARYVLCGSQHAATSTDLAGVETLTTEQLRSEAPTFSTAPVPHPDTAPDDRLLLYFTSGTTTRPKLVEHTQVSYPVGHLTTMNWLGLRPGDVHLNISSPGWAKHAWSSFFAPWLAEATVMVYAYDRFDAGALLPLLSEHGVSSLCAPPTVWRMLINADLGGRPTALRELASAGEPLNPEVISQVRHAWGLTIRDGFGQTETTALIGNTPDSPLKVGSMGRPLPGVPVVLVDPLTGESTVGEGEICLDLGGDGRRRPLNLMTGYIGDPERAAAAVSGGYYHTGDVATMDDDGYITFIGRTDDVFKSSDYKVSPFELESVLIEHPAVAEAAIVPAPDPVRLAVPKAYVALAPGYASNAETARDVLDFARRRLPGYLRVRRIEFYDLPKTISGKIRRVDLRAREANSAQPFPLEYRDDQFPGLKD